ncbi:MAG: putative toxin-antitoxin system toxin component, PIN family [Ardenticatenaceae bacterium]|nr:putative toxin-antitoxin system toxin component, PIN family [Ardenticatenaceae bacterium]
MSKPRFVLDTNLIVSAALLEKSPARQAFEVALLQGSILVSEALQAELSEVLLRHKFDRYLSAEKRLRFLTSFISLAVPTAVTQSITICRDPKDNMVLELAVCGQASIILTGDKDLLVLHPFRDISILSPHDFLEELGGVRK